MVKIKENYYPQFFIMRSNVDLRNDLQNVRYIIRPDCFA